MRSAEIGGTDLSPRSCLYLIKQPMECTSLDIHTIRMLQNGNKIMTQKNEMSARALSMEELENVNGGIRVKSKGGETDPRQKRFEVRVK